MKTDAETTVIYLEKDAEDIRLYDELRKISGILSDYKNSLKEAHKTFPCFFDLTHTLKDYIDR